MDLRTNYRQEFVNHELPSKSSPAYSAKEVPTTNQHVYTRRPMNGISQTSFDFRPYPKHRPPLPIENEPFQSQVQIGNSYSQVEKSVSRFSFVFHKQCLNSSEIRNIEQTIQVMMSVNILDKPQSLPKTTNSPTLHLHRKWTVLLLIKYFRLISIFSRNRFLSARFSTN